MQNRRTNWFWRGFIGGATIGLVFSAIALGFLGNDLRAMTLAKIVINVVIGLGWLTTVYNARKRSALFSTNHDGAIAGFVFTSEISAWAFISFLYP
jgi:hypothetical protein